MTDATNKDMRVHIPWHQVVIMERDAKIKDLEEQLETAKRHERNSEIQMARAIKAESDLELYRRAYEEQEERANKLERNLKGADLAVATARNAQESAERDAELMAGELRPLVLENKKLRRVISHVADSMKHTPHMDANEFSLLQWLLEKSIEEQK